MTFARHRRRERGPSVDRTHRELPLCAPQQASMTSRGMQELEPDRGATPCRPTPYIEFRGRPYVDFRVWRLHG
jgi:hypothetical protein